MTKRMWFSWLLVLVVASAGVLPAASAERAAPGAAGRPAATTMSASQFESRLAARTNHRRVRHGCRPIRLNAALVQAARQHSTRMAAQGELSHQLAGEPPLQDRAVAAGYTSWRLLAENIAWGQSTPGEVFRAWVHSAPHRENLDNCRLRDIGVGVVISGGRPWVTEDFGHRHH